MITVHFDFPEEADAESIRAAVAAVPAIGTTVGIRNSPPPNEDHYRLDKVMDVRHYFSLLDDGTAYDQEIRVLLGNG